MGYRIRPEKRFSPEIRRIATEQLRQAMTTLDRQPDGLHAAVHEARKNFKRARALHRLIANGNPKISKRENARIGRIGRSLSTVRDATALVDVASDLRQHAATPQESVALLHIHHALLVRRQKLIAGETDLVDRTKAAIAACRKSIKATDRLKLGNRRKKIAARLGKAWERTLVQAAAALSACERGGDENLFHDLRKCCQTYAMHLALLRDIWPSAMRAKRAAVKQLVALLGHDHDLSVLGALVNETPEAFGAAEDLSYLLSAIIAHQQPLRLEALELARTVFSDKPRKESRRIRLLWLDAAA